MAPNVSGAYLIFIDEILMFSNEEIIDNPLSNAFPKLESIGS
jgi:hypothetical protein